MNKKLLKKSLFSLSLLSIVGIGIGGIIYSLRENKTEKRIPLPFDVYTHENGIITGFTEEFISNPDKYSDCNTMMIPNQLPNQDGTMDTITEIGSEAFSISNWDWVFPKFIKILDFDSDSKITKISSYAFESGWDEVGFLYNVPLEKIYLPKSLIEIEEYAFCACWNINFVDFSKCIQLTTIGESAFTENYSLTSIDFSKCTNLSSIVDEAYSLCPLKSIKFSSENNYLGLATNLGSKAQVIVQKNGNTCEWSETNPTVGCLATGDISFPDGIVRIPDKAFDQCLGLTNVLLPSTLLTISDEAFNYCVQIKTVNFKKCVSLTTIRSSAFAHNISLNEILLPEGLTEIGPIAFSECSSLTSISLPSTLSKISTNCFPRCFSLKNISISPENSTYGLATNLGSNAQAIVKKNGDTCEWSNTNQVVGELACGDVEFNDNVTEISKDDFSLTAISSIYINKNINNIGASTFFGDCFLKNISISPENSTYGLATNLGSNAQAIVQKNGNTCEWSNTNQVVGYLACGDIVLPEGLTDLNDSFQHCSITSIYIPNSLTSFANSVFFGDDNLTKIIWDINKDFTDYTFKERCFQGMPRYGKIYTTKKSKYSSKEILKWLQNDGKPLGSFYAYNWVAA